MDWEKRMAAPRGAAAKAAMNKAPAMGPKDELTPTRKPFPPPEKKAPAKVAAPAEGKAAGADAKPVREKDPARVAAAEKAKATAVASAAAGGEQKCAGACGEVKPIRSFPTTGTRADGTIGRGKECRACRDAKRSANKTAASAS